MFSTHKGATFRSVFKDFTQLVRHGRQCDLIDCTTVFQSEFEKSFISYSVLVEFTCFILFSAT